MLLAVLPAADEPAEETDTDGSFRRVAPEEGNTSNVRAAQADDCPNSHQLESLQLNVAACPVLDDEDVVMAEGKSSLPIDVDPEEVTTEQEDTDSMYVPACEVVSYLSKKAERIKEHRRFVRLAISDKAGMLFSKLLNLSISYEPDTRIMPCTPEIIIGVTENAEDFPSLAPGQRRVSPVLVTMPSGVTFSQPLMIRCPLLYTRTPGHRISVLCSDTEVTEPTRWTPARDVECYSHDDLMKISLHLRHFCLYCVIEEKIQTVSEHRPKVVSIYLR